MSLPYHFFAQAAYTVTTLGPVEGTEFRISGVPRGKAVANLRLGWLTFAL